MTRGMEDTLLSVFVVVVSLILSKDHNVFHEQDDDIIVSMQDHEHFLLKEKAKLEQGEHPVAIELPYSNQEASQSHRKLPIEGHVSDVKQIEPNVETKVLHEEQMSSMGEQNEFRQKASDDQEILSIDKDKWTVHMASEGPTNEQVRLGSTVDQNVSQGEAEHPEEPKYDRIDTHREHQADEGFDQKIPTSSQRLTTRPQEKQPNDQDVTFIYFLWRTYSIISLFHFLKRFLKKGSKTQKMLRSTNVSKIVSNIDYKTLTSFHNQCVVLPRNHSWQTCEFVEGFVNDLLETVRNSSTAGADMEIEDFVGIGSFYEQWASRKSVVCDIHVPIIPPKSCSFEFTLLKENRGSTAQNSCRIKMVKNSGNCHCNSSNIDNPDDDDLLCLLHLDNKIDDHAPDKCINDLCQENTSYLAKTKVLKWFKSTVRKAWNEISHKYDFELIFRNRENPGSLKVRFRSGRVIQFRLTPVVRFKDSEAHLMSYLPSDVFSDTYWPVCFARYENALLQHLTNTLPDNACHIYVLQMLSFLHKHQTGLTGPCGLTSYHLKTALLHLLLKKTLHWEPEQIGCRLNDLFTFLLEKLNAKMLDHVLVANPLIPCVIGLPKEFTEGKPVNLFLPLLSDDKLYLKTNRHLLEMIKNMPVLIQEYGSVRNALQQNHL
ncbi:inositol 1,4,5-trisphosphate receptor-interacting protein isoform X1 [Danio rerio]|uniref:Inositol 1,4,5-trisphosphate receptor-interacting protein isoform X1 n=2 Tax=Danio rerio TaxID=7955 RepID=A0AC58JW50_DANRE